MVRTCKKRGEREREKVEVRTLQKVLIDLKIITARCSSRTKSSCPVDGFGLKVAHLKSVPNCVDPIDTIICLRFELRLFEFFCRKHSNLFTCSLMDRRFRFERTA